MNIGRDKKSCRPWWSYILNLSSSLTQDSGVCAVYTKNQHMLQTQAHEMKGHNLRPKMKTILVYFLLFKLFSGHDKTHPPWPPWSWKPSTCFGRDQDAGRQNEQRGEGGWSSRERSREASGSWGNNRGHDWGRFSTLLCKRDNLWPKGFHWTVTSTMLHIMVHLGFSWVAVMRVHVFWPVLNLFCSQLVSPTRRLIRQDLVAEVVSRKNFSV